MLRISPLGPGEAVAALGDKFPAFKSETGPASTVSSADALSVSSAPAQVAPVEMSEAGGATGTETPASMPGLNCRSPSATPPPMPRFGPAPGLDQGAMTIKISTLNCWNSGWAILKTCSAR